MSSKTIAIIIAAAFIAIGLIVWLSTDEAPEREAPPPVAEQPAQEPVPTPPEPEPEPEPVPEPAPPPEPAEPPIQVPETLEQADAAMIDTATELSPPLAEWTVEEQPVRKWVATVEQFAAGVVPEKNLPLDYPAPKYAVREENGKLYPAPANYDRADALVQAITAIEPETFARYYKAWRPLLNSAYQELGKGGSLDDRLETAIARVLSTRPLDEPPVLVKEGPFYAYADEELENATELEKFLWRMGPDNMETLQTYLREVAEHL